MKTDIAKRVCIRKGKNNHSLFLESFDRVQHSCKPEYAFLESARMFGDLTGLGGGFTARSTLDHDVEIDKLLCECRHVIFEAKGVFSGDIGGQNKVSLTLLLAIKDYLVTRVSDFIVDIERTSRLHLHRYKTHDVGRSKITHSKIELQDQSVNMKLETDMLHTPIFSPALSTSV